jgi:hypothetical protein
MGARNLSHSDSFAGPILEVQAASAAGGGTSLSTAAVLVELANQATHLSIIPRNFATAVVAQFALNPYLSILFNNDGMATTPVDNSANAQDASASTNVVVSALKTLVNGGSLWVGSPVPFRGVKVVLVGANANASALTGKYWNGSAFVDASITDGTTTGGKTFGQSGDITFTVPSAWSRSTIEDILAVVGPPLAAGPFANSKVPLYWMRFEVSAAMSATVTASSILAYNRSTAYAELESEMAWSSRMFKGLGGISCVEAKVNAGTGNLMVNCSVDMGSKLS